MEISSNLWSWFTADIPVASKWFLIFALTLGFALACVPAVWRYTRLFATYIHEAGHAVFAMLTGRRVTRIRLEADTSGTTEHVGTANWFSRVITAFAGYPAPALAGFGILVAVAAGHPRWVLAGFAVLAFLLLGAQRSLRGLWLTVLIGLGVYFVGLIGNEFASVILVVVAGYLLAASPRTVIDLHYARRLKRVQIMTDQHSDADSLAALTLFPPVFWEAIFMIVSLFLVICGVITIVNVS